MHLKDAPVKSRKQMSIEESDHRIVTIEMRKKTTNVSHPDEDVTIHEKKGILLMKIFYLVLLAVTNAVILVLLHATKTRSGPVYYSSTAVVVCEVVKVVICAVVTLFKRRRACPTDIYAHTCGDVRDWAKVSLPAVLYVIQNNLIFFALSLLSAVEFQVMYQLKIITTAIFSVVWLRKKITHKQWFALVLLFSGVVVMESGDNSLAGSDTRLRLHARAAVVTAAILSGVSAVYFEGMLKSGKTSIWIRNIQLGVPGAIFATLTFLSRDYNAIQYHDFFYGYDWKVWLLISLQSGGGLLIACVVTVTDNLVKTFAIAASIVLSGLASTLIFSSVLTTVTLSGMSLVVVAGLLYGT